MSPHIIDHVSFEFSMRDKKEFFIACRPLFTWFDRSVIAEVRSCVLWRVAGYIHDVLLNDVRSCDSLHTPL